MPRNNRRHQNVNSGEFSSSRLQFSPEIPPPSTKPNPRFLSLLLQALVMTFVISLFFIFIGIAAIIFLHLCVAGGALSRRRNRRRPVYGAGHSSSGYSPEDLKALPKSRFRGSQVCAICLDNLLEGEICRVLPRCNHVFHLGCVDKWLLKSPACPVCRSSVRLSSPEPKRTAVLGWEQLWAACA